MLCHCLPISEVDTINFLCTCRVRERCLHVGKSGLKKLVLKEALDSDFLGLLPYFITIAVQKF